MITHFYQTVAFSIRWRFLWGQAGFLLEDGVFHRETSRWYRWAPLQFPSREAWGPCWLAQSCQVPAYYSALAPGKPSGRESHGAHSANPTSAWHLPVLSASTKCARKGNNKTERGRMNVRRAFVFEPSCCPETGARCTWEGAETRAAPPPPPQSHSCRWQAFLQKSLCRRKQGVRRPTGCAPRTLAPSPAAGVQAQMSQSRCTLSTGMQMLVKGKQQSRVRMKTGAHQASGPQCGRPGGNPTSSVSCLQDSCCPAPGAGRCVAAGPNSPGLVIF